VSNVSILYFTLKSFLGIEATHKYGNKADSRSKGKNIQNSFDIFLKRHILLTFSVNFPSVVE